MSCVSVVGRFSTVLGVVFSIVRGHKCEGNLRNAGPFILFDYFSSVVLIPRVPSSAGLCFVGTYFQSSKAVVYVSSFSRLALYVFCRLLMFYSQCGTAVLSVQCVIFEIGIVVFLLKPLYHWYSACVDCCM